MATAFRLFASGLCALLAACAGGGSAASEPAAAVPPEEGTLAKTLVYDCQGYEFVARTAPDEMALWLPDRYLVLPRVRSGSGSRYEQGQVMFWSKGDTAMLTVGEQQYRDCRLAPQRVPWEDARRRGVNFRAVGNEPGWSLEIQNGRHLLFVGDYAMQRLVTPDPGVRLEGATRSYHAVTATADLRVEIVAADCADTMSGEAFTSRVVVTVNKVVFYGCGRDLDYPWQ
jgi:putative lipoprotein